MRVVWTDKACADLKEIRLYLSQQPHRKSAAEASLCKLIRKTESLSGAPSTGRIVPEYNTAIIRELIEGAYRVVYSLTKETIYILTVVEGSNRQLTAAPPT